MICRNFIVPFLNHRWHITLWWAIKPSIIIIIAIIYIIIITIIIIIIIIIIINIIVIIVLHLYYHSNKKLHSIVQVNQKKSKTNKQKMKETQKMA